MSQVAWWMPYVPASLREKLEGRPLARAILGNTGWLFADRLMRMGVALGVGVWVARYLGPVQYGVLSYSASLGGLFVVLAGLDLDSVMVRELSLRPEARGAILGTVSAMRGVGGLISFGLAVVSARFLRPDNAQVQLLTAVYALALFSPSMDGIETWFRSRLEASSIVAARGIPYLMVACLRIALILTGAGLLSFAGAAIAEAWLGSVGLWIAYKRFGGSLKGWRWDAAWARSLWRESLPLMASTLAVMIYMRSDQFMLAAMAGDAQVGLYAAATRLSEIWYFAPMALASSAGPALARAFAEDASVFRARRVKLFRAMLTVSLPLALVVSLIARPLCRFLFGIAFAGAGPVLALHIWAAIFVFIGVAQGAGEVASGRMRQMVVRTWAGAALNIGLNLWFIPIWQASGAALATVIAYAVAGSGALLFTRGGRQDLRLQWEALRWWR